MIVKKRCPWCAEQLIHHNYHEERSGAIRCNACGKWSTFYNKILFNLTAISIFVISIALAVLQVSIHIIIVIFSLLMGVFTYYDTMPLKRIARDEPEWKLHIEETSFGTFDIKWNENKIKVFGPWSNTILFLCAVNQYNVPSSNMYCVRVTKKGGKYKITQIDDRIDSAQILSLFQLKSTNLNLFNEKKVVGSLLLNNMNTAEK